MGDVMSVFVRSATLGAASQLFGNISLEKFRHLSLAFDRFNELLREPRTLCSKLIHQPGPFFESLIRKFCRLPLINRGFHELDVLIRNISKHGDRGLVFQLTLGLHHVHHDVRGLVVHFFRDEHIRQEHQGPDVALLRAIRVGCQFFIELQPLSPKNPLKLQILENCIAVLLGEPQIQLIRYKEELFTLPNHLGARFLVPSQVIEPLQRLVAEQG